MSVHPHIDSLGQQLTKNADGSLAVPVPALEGFLESAQTLTSGQELYSMITDLGAFATVLATRRDSPTAAEALYDLLVPLVHRLVELAKTEGQELNQKADQLRKRIDDEKQALRRNTGPLGGLAPAAGAGIKTRRS